MTPRFTIEVEAEAFERIGADVVVAGLFEDERPLRGGVGLADWRLCGWLSELVRHGSVRGSEGELVLVPTYDRLGAPSLLLMGLGSRQRFDLDGLCRATTVALEQAHALGARSVLLGLPLPLRETRLPRISAALLEGLLAPRESGEGSLWVRILPAPLGAEALRGALGEALRKAGTRGRQVALRPADSVHGATCTP